MGKRKKDKLACYTQLEEGWVRGVGGWVRGEEGQGGAGGGEMGGGERKYSNVFSHMS